MHFNTLDTQIKIALHNELNTYVTALGGKNFFLQMIEDVKKQSPHPLLSDAKTCRYAKGILKWEKKIYKDTLALLYAAIRRDDKAGDMLEGLSPKEYKKTMNMIRTLSPVRISVEPKGIEDVEGFSFSILDTTQEKKTRISWIFKVIFSYDMDFIKKVLNYEVREEK